MSFIFAISVLAFACALISIKTLVGYTDQKKIVKFIISTLIITAWFAPLLIKVFEKFKFINPENLMLIAKSLYFGLGFVFILFILLITRDILWYVFYTLAWIIKKSSWHIHPKNLSLLSHANFATIICAVIISVYAYAEGAIVPRTKTIEFQSPKIAQTIKIVQLSDIHLEAYSNLKKLAEIVQKVNAMEPDVIVITGDSVDDSVEKLQTQIKLLAKLKAKYGVFISNGNHEAYAGLLNWYVEFEKRGFVVVNNTGFFIKDLNLYIAGVPDLYTNTVNLAMALKNSQEDNYRLLLSHHPMVIDFIYHNDVDLQLSGHTHGGQIFPLNFLSQKINKYLSGTYKINNVDLYVSRGTGAWGPQMRLFAPAEITEIILKHGA